VLLRITTYGQQGRKDDPFDSSIGMIRHHHQRPLLRDIGKILRGNLVNDLEGPQDSFPDLILILRLVNTGIKVVQFLPAQDVLNGRLCERRDLSGKGLGKGYFNLGIYVLPPPAAESSCRQGLRREYRETNRFLGRHAECIHRQSVIVCGADDTQVKAA
jgi:hypothetical protein